MAISTEDIPALLEEAYNMRSELCLCLMGAPGIGKTQGIYEFAASKGVDVVEIIASQILPNEVSGITMPVNESHSMEIYDHARLSSLKDGDILFFDELLQAAPQTLSACLTLIQERRMMSGKKLPDIMIIAAANPLPSANNIPLSIRQRFQFVDVSWDRKQWSKYIKQKYGVCPDSDLWRYIRTKGETWNVLTPRTATKLIASGIKSNCSDAWKLLAKEITGDEVIVNQIENIITNKKRSPKEQLVAALSKAMNQGLIGPGAAPIIEENDMLSLQEMIELLQVCPDWERIQQILAEIEED